MRDISNNDTASLHLTNLTPFTRYAYYIKAYSLNIARSGAQSTVQYFKTLSGKPTRPLKVQANVLSDSAIVRFIFNLI